MSSSHLTTLGGIFLFAIHLTWHQRKSHPTFPCGFIKWITPSFLSWNTLIIIIICTISLPFENSTALIIIVFSHFISNSSPGVGLQMSQPLKTFVEINRFSWRFFGIWLIGYRNIRLESNLSSDVYLEAISYKKYHKFVTYTMYAINYGSFLCYMPNSLKVCDWHACGSSTWIIYHFDLDAYILLSVIPSLSWVLLHYLFVT